MKLTNLCGRPELVQKAASWFSSKWGVSADVYAESISKCDEAVPRWYVILDKEENIIAGAGIVENDFNERKDLSPNLCALFVEEEWRNQGLAGELLDFALRDMAGLGIEKLYLVTEHTGFYEKYGWRFLTMAKYDDGEMMRLYAADCRG